MVSHLNALSARRVMADEHDQINEAFENLLETYLSNSVREKIAASYGQDIATKVKAIYDDALKCPVDWQSANIDTALPVLHELMSSKYPWLSDKARSNIAYAFIMEWK